MEKINFESLQFQAPKAYDDFLDFSNEILSSSPFSKTVNINSLPFEMQLGFFLKYFNQNGIELDVCNTDFSLLPERIIEAFKEFEKVISHSS
ncbi:MAG: hypothetical protein K2X86_18210 [Cytophagaceae bacterium]|nr:hypothetical protein [Cytophagaceae bacterium]